MRRDSHAHHPPQLQVQPPHSSHSSPNVATGLGSGVPTDRASHAPGVNEREPESVLGRSNAASDFPNLIVFNHPLIQHKLTWIRDETTSHRPFRALLSQIAGLMVFEVTRSFPTSPTDVRTPMEVTVGQRLSATITVVPVLRSGLGMAEGILDIMPEARVGHLGLARDEESLQPITYLKRLPRGLDAGPVILVDPMLATGGSAVAALETLKREGARDLRMICLVAAPIGVERLLREHPDVMIYTAALDRGLTDKGFIVPGLGDAGDRMYGTV